VEQSGVRDARGANIGFQWGVQSTELVLVLMSQRSVEGIAGGKVTLGADASVAAGPVGRSAAAATDTTFKAQVLSYARNEGIFIGVSLDGSHHLGGRRLERPRLRRTRRTALADPRRQGRGATGGAGVHGTAEQGHERCRRGTDRSGPVATPAPQGDSQPAESTDTAKTYPMEDPEPGAPPPP
jgi:hypothetical protein